MKNDEDKAKNAVQQEKVKTPEEIEKENQAKFLFSFKVWQEQIFGINSKINVTAKNNHEGC